MATKILVPELGESVLEATVSRWLKKEGEAVNVGDVLVELETDKVNLEVGAKSAGVLAKIEVPEGKDVKVGEVLGTIDEQGKPPAKAPAPQETAKETPKPQPVEEKQAAIRGDGRKAEQHSAPQLTPVASRMARENNIDISQLSGTGGEGRVTRSDVEQFMLAHQKEKATGEQVAVKPEAEPEKSSAGPSLQQPEASA